MPEQRYSHQTRGLLQAWIFSTLYREVANAIDRVYAIMATRDTIEEHEEKPPLLSKSALLNRVLHPAHQSFIFKDSLNRLNKCIKWPTHTLNKRALVRRAAVSDPRITGDSILVTLSDGKNYVYGLLPSKGLDSNDSSLESSSTESIIIIRSAKIELFPLRGSNMNSVCDLCVNIEDYVGIRYPGALSSTYQPKGLSQLDSVIWELVRLAMYGIPCNPRWKNINFPITYREATIPKDQLSILGYRTRPARGGKKKKKLNAMCVNELGNSLSADRALDILLNVQISKSSGLVLFNLKHAWEELYEFAKFPNASFKNLRFNIRYIAANPAPIPAIYFKSCKIILDDAVDKLIGNVLRGIPAQRRLIKCKRAKKRRELLKIPRFEDMRRPITKSVYVPLGSKWRSHEKFEFILKDLV